MVRGGGLELERDGGARDLCRSIKCSRRGYRSWGGGGEKECSKTIRTRQAGNLYSESAQIVSLPSPSLAAEVQRPGPGAPLLSSDLFMSDIFCSHLAGCVMHDIQKRNELTPVTAPMILWKLYG